MHYRVISPLRHDGRTYTVGERVELAALDAAGALINGAVEPLAAPVASPAATSAGADSNPVGKAPRRSLRLPAAHLR